jgi:hypothetical protein
MTLIIVRERLRDDLIRVFGQWKAGDAARVEVLDRRTTLRRIDISGASAVARMMAT